MTPSGSTKTRLRRLSPTSSEPSYYGVRYEKLSFESGYVAPEGSARADERWNAPPNRTAHAYVLRRRGPRPWLIIQHGYGGGQIAEFLMMGALALPPAARLQRDRHDRAVSRRTEGVPAQRHGDDVVRLRPQPAFLRPGDVGHPSRDVMGRGSKDATSISLYGVSMGGYIASLVAGVDPRLRTVIAGIPAIDMAAAIRRRTPTSQWPDLDRNGLFGECLDIIHRPVSPLSVRARSCRTNG